MWVQKGSGYSGDMLDVTVYMGHYLSVTLQSHSPWKDFSFWSCGHSGGLLPGKLSAQLQPRVAPLDLAGWFLSAQSAQSPADPNLLTLSFCGSL